VSAGAGTLPLRGRTAARPRHVGSALPAAHPRAAGRGVRRPHGVPTPAARRAARCSLLGGRRATSATGALPVSATSVAPPWTGALRGAGPMPASDCRRSSGLIRRRAYAPRAPRC